MHEQLHRCLRQVIGSCQHVVGHSSTPAMHAIGTRYSCPQRIKTFVGLKQRFRRLLKIISASILHLLENQQISINRVDGRDRDGILPAEGRQFEPCLFVVRVLAKG